MNVQKIKSLANKDFLRSNRYEISIASGIKNRVVSAWQGPLLDDICSNCVAVDFPSSSYGTFLWRNKGPAIKLPNDKIFADLNMSFYNDSEGNARKFFGEWHDSILDANNNFRFFEEYIGNIRIKEFDVNGKVAMACEVEQVWPTAIHAIPLSYENENMVEKVNVTFSMTKFNMIDV